MKDAEEQHQLLVATTRLERDRLRVATAEGIAVKVTANVFARPSYWDGLSMAQKARHKVYAVQRLHPDWVFAGPTAALVQGLSVSNRYLERLYVAAATSNHRYNNRDIYSVLVSNADVVEHDGIRMTERGRTMGDCLRLMDFRSGLAVADAALRAYRLSRTDLAASVSKACTHVPGARRIFSVISLADGKAESGGESIVRATMLELGMMLPDLQRSYDDPLEYGKSYRADYAWDVYGGTILGELDGNEKYTNPDMTAGRSIIRLIEDEHRRHSHIEARPDVLRIVRFGFADAMNDQSFLDLLVATGVPRTYALDEKVSAAGGVLRCR